MSIYKYTYVYIYIYTVCIHNIHINAPILNGKLSQQTSLNPLAVERPHGINQQVLRFEPYVVRCLEATRGSGGSQGPMNWGDEKKWWGDPVRPSRAFSFVSRMPSNVPFLAGLLWKIFETMALPGTLPVSMGAWGDPNHFNLQSYPVIQFWHYR